MTMPTPPMFWGAAQNQMRPMQQMPPQQMPPQMMPPQQMMTQQMTPQQMPPAQYFGEQSPQISPMSFGQVPQDPMAFWNMIQAGLPAPGQPFQVDQPQMPPQMGSGMDSQTMQMAMMGDFSGIQQHAMKEQQMRMQMQQRQLEWEQKMRQQAEKHQAEMAMMNGAGMQVPQAPSALQQWGGHQQANQLLNGQTAPQMSNPFQDAHQEQVQSAMKRPTSLPPQAQGHAWGMTQQPPQSGGFGGWGGFSRR